MSRHPYDTIGRHQRWRTAMAAPDPSDIDPVTEPPFRLSPTDRIATAGSCFAQHIGARLEAGGLTRLVTETAHPVVPAAEAQAMGYGLYTARFGNIYSARQLLQLLRRAYGRFTPQEPAWTDAKGGVIDPFRPGVQPGGFSTLREHDADRAQHLAAVRRMIEEADVLLFTLGLTECWVSREDGAVFPICPGVMGGTFDPQRYSFVNFGAEEVIADLRAFLSEARAINPALRVVLTVSPVPLAATAEPRHVWTSTTWSKAVLRVAAEAVTDAAAAYFPSYEIITSPAARGAYYGDDLRSVTPAGVDHVMRMFFRHMTSEDAQAPTTGAGAPQRETFLEQAKAAMEVVCEEASLDQG